MPEEARREYWVLTLELQMAVSFLEGNGSQTRVLLKSRWAISAGPGRVILKGNFLTVSNQTINFCDRNRSRKGPGTNRLWLPAAWLWKVGCCLTLGIQTCPSGNLKLVGCSVRTSRLNRGCDSSLSSSTTCMGHREDLLRENGEHLQETGWWLSLWPEVGGQEEEEEAFSGSGSCPSWGPPVGSDG